MSKCNQAINELSNYLDGDLDESLRRMIEDHLKLCQHCQVIFDTTRKTVELYCDGKLFPLPAGVRDRLHAALEKKWAEKTR